MTTPGPLAGLRIIDMTSVLMGPFATQALGDMGADVIKVEAPQGDLVRQIGPARHDSMGPIFLNTNRNKRSLTLDLKKPEGREVFLRLVAKADTKHERCDLCGLVLPMTHEHLFDVERRRLQCACTACSVLFDATAGKRRRVRRRCLRLEPFRMSDAQWEALEVPVGLAFFSYSSSLRNVIAAYPGPAGAVESVVSDAAWADLVRDNAVLAEIEADTAAFLVDRLSAEPSYHVLSIDECYRLTGLVRKRWHGLTGGDGPLQAVREFLSGLSGGPS